MNREMRARPGVRILAMATAAVTILASVIAPRVFAQTPAPTLTAPKAQSKTPQSAPAKAAPSGRANPCSIYGKGFTNVPGTDTCVKVDGSIQTDVGVNVRR